MSSYSTKNIKDTFEVTFKDIVDTVKFKLYPDVESVYNSVKNNIYTLSGNIDDTQFETTLYGPFSDFIDTNSDPNNLQNLLNYFYNVRSEFNKYQLDQEVLKMQTLLEQLIKKLNNYISNIVSSTGSPAPAPSSSTTTLTLDKHIEEIDKLIKDFLNNPNTKYVFELNKSLKDIFSDYITDKGLDPNNDMGLDIFNHYNNKLKGIENNILFNILTSKTQCNNTLPGIQKAHFNKQGCNSGDNLLNILRSVNSNKNCVYFGVGGTTTNDLAQMLLRGGSSVLKPIQMESANYTNTLIDTLNKLIKNLEKKGFSINVTDKSNLDNAIKTFSDEEIKITDFIKKYYEVYERSKHVDNILIDADGNPRKDSLGNNMKEYAIDTTKIDDLKKMLETYKKTEKKLCFTIQKLTDCLKSMP